MLGPFLINIYLVLRWYFVTLSVLNCIYIFVFGPSSSLSSYICWPPCRVFTILIFVNHYHINILKLTFGDSGSFCSQSLYFEHFQFGPSSVDSSNIMFYFHSLFGIWSFENSYKSINILLSYFDFGASSILSIYIC